MNHLCGCQDKITCHSWCHEAFCTAHMCRSGDFDIIGRGIDCSAGVVGSHRELMPGSVQAADFWALGLEPMALSAISGSGSGDLLDRLVAALPPPAPADAADVRPARVQHVQFDVLPNCVSHCRLRVQTRADRQGVQKGASRCVYGV